MAKRKPKQTFVAVVGLGILCGAWAPAHGESRGAVFGIKPGVAPVQSSYLGLDLGRWQPFVGIDLATLSVNPEGDYDDFSAVILIPHLGAKFYFHPERTAGDVAAYLQGDMLFSIASVSADDLSPGEDAFIKDLLGFYGFSLAFGAEYYFADRFSIGGEYGLRYFAVGVDEHSDTIDTGGGSFEDHVNDKFDATFGISYVAITLNFHL